MAVEQSGNSAFFFCPENFLHDIRYLLSVNELTSRSINATVSTMKTTKNSIYDGAVPASEYYRSKGKPDASLLRGTIRTTRHLVPKEQRSTKRERTIQTEIIQFLKKLGFWVYKLKAVNLVGSAAEGTLSLASVEPGLPDLISISPRGQVLAIEVKSASGRAKITEAQLRQLQRLRDHKCHAIVAHSVAAVADYITQSDNLVADPETHLLPSLKGKVQCS